MHPASICYDKCRTEHGTFENIKSIKYQIVSNIFSKVSMELKQSTGRDDN